jgi:nucleoside-diphosphate-sugar epimerase
MVVGNGLIAKAFQEFETDNSILIFASGVSNSTEIEPTAFKRELALIKKEISNNPEATFVYFSSTGLFDKTICNTKYIQHKLKMERYVESNVSSYLIFRISNAVGFSKNPHTILNFLVNAVKGQQNLTICKNAERNLIDVDDIVFVVNLCLKYEKNKILTVASKENIKVIDILVEIEKFLGVKANATFIKKGVPFNLDLSETEKYLNLLDNQQKSAKQYLQSLLHKYYTV